MRIDKFLKVSRILKRRTVAQEACGEDKVLINGKTAKPSAPVKIGDVVEVLYASGSLKFRVLNVKETVKKEEAASLYEVISCTRRAASASPRSSARREKANARDFPKTSFCKKSAERPCWNARSPLSMFPR